MAENADSTGRSDFQREWAELELWLNQMAKEMEATATSTEHDYGEPRAPKEWTDDELKRFQKESFADGEKSGILIGLLFGFFVGLVACTSGLL